MKNYFNYFRFLLVAIMLASASQLYADKTTETEGTSFWFAIPTARTGLNEPTRGAQNDKSAEELYITSKVDATVTIYTSSNNFSSPFEVVTVKANSKTVVSLLKHVQDSVGEKIETKKAYYVKSDQPISLVVYIAWYWTGEAFRIVPEDWLGTEYYTLNLYNDYCKMVDTGLGHYSTFGTFRAHPGQILIVATEDNTTVTYTPTADTRLVPAGTSKTITMNKGNTYLILSKIYYDGVMAKGNDESTDLSGTRIVANKKIAVYSGHTKGAYPRFAPNYMSASGYSGDFLRNMLFDSMWPVELLGKEYVTVPNIFTNVWGVREYQGKLADERGDLIRFVATKDNTTIWEINTSGEEVLLKSRLKRGERYDIPNRETPGHFRSNNPLVVGQYSKGWFWWSGNISYKEGGSNNKEDELQNPPRAGQGMLYTVTPTEQWSNYAGFISVKGVNNHFNVIFNTGDETKIFYREKDNTSTQSLKQKFSGNIKTIPGSPYSYLQTKVGDGNYSIESTEPGVKFALYAYGNMDAYKDGFAYGYPTNVNYFTPCEDSIIVATDSQCEIVNGTIEIRDLIGDEPCAAIQNVRVDPISQKNANLTRTIDPEDKRKGTFTIKFLDKTKDGYIKVTVLSKSGNTLTKEFSYSPELIAADKAQISFNKLQINVPSVQEITITNPSNKTPLNIKRLYLKDAATKLEFQILEPAIATDIVIAPLASITVKIRASLPRETSVIDELWAELSCYSQKLTTIRANSGTPIISVADLAFGTVSLTLQPKKVLTTEIKNEGSVTASITGYRLKNNEASFTFDCPALKAATPEAPLDIEPGTPVKIVVTYDPAVDGVDHTEILELISSNATTRDLESIWTGKAVNATVSVTSKDWNTVRVIDDWSITKDNVTKYNGTITVTNSGSEKVSIIDVVRLKGVYDGGVVGTENYTDAVLNLDATVVAELKANGLEAGASKDIPVTFIPTEQLKYFCGIKVVGEIAATKAPLDIPFASLKGIGKQPHVSTADVDFERLNLNNVTTVTKLVPVYATSLTELDYNMDLTVVGLKIGKNIDPIHTGMFNIDESQFELPTQSKPIKIKVGESLMVPVIFTPPAVPSEIDYTAQLVISSDAPVTTDDDSISVLKGRAYKSNVASEGYDFKVTYMKTTSLENGKVTFTNKGTVDVYLTKSILSSLKDMDNNSGHKAMFQLSDQNYLLSKPTEYYAQMEEDIKVPAGETFVVPIVFRPDAAQDYKAKIEFVYAEEDKTNPTATEVAKITGSGKLYLADCSIPTGYTAKPGDYISYKRSDNGAKIEYAEFRLKRRAEETKDLSDAAITKFEASFQFADDVLDLAAGMKHVYPLLNSNGLVDIVTENTMTSGWEIKDVKITDRKTLVVTFNSHNGVLTKSNDDVLFKFRMLGYLSQSKEKIKLIPNFKPDAILHPYFFTEPHNGDVEIDPVCIDNARLVTTSGLNGQIGKMTPNPIVSSSVIDYSVSIECPVLIEVFNSNGSKVSTLVNNEMKKPGNYQLNVNPEALGLSNGTYTYRIEMGGYSETKTFVVNR